MLVEDVQSIDNLIAFIKSKVFLSIDIRFILLLEVVRLELVSTRKLSDITAGAVSRLFTFQAHEFYYRDFPELYDECSSVSFMLRKYNEKFMNHENLPNPGIDDKSWSKYFNKAISSLLTENKSSITELNAVNTGFPK